MIARLGKEIDDPNSVYYWAHKVIIPLHLVCPPALVLAGAVVVIVRVPLLDEINILCSLQNNIPVLCPAITDGAIGDMIFLHSYSNPGLIVDIAQGIYISWCMSV